MGSAFVRTNPTIIAYRQRRRMVSFLMRRINKQILHLSSPMLVNRKICVIHVMKLTYS